MIHLTHHSIVFWSTKINEMYKITHSVSITEIVKPGQIISSDEKIRSGVSWSEED